MAEVTLTPGETLVIDIETERKKYEFYEATGGTRGKETAKVFIRLARHGREHEHLFRDILTDAGGYSPEKTGINFAYLQGIADSSIYNGHRLSELASKNNLTDIEAVEAALAAEKDSILLYTEGRDLIPQKDLGVLDEIISEAKDHVSKLTPLLRKLRGETAR